MKNEELDVKKMNYNNLQKYSCAWIWKYNLFIDYLGLRYINGKIVLHNEFTGEDIKGLSNVKRYLLVNDFRLEKFM